MTYQIDPKHSAAHFQVRHMTIAFVKGEFGNVTGTVDFDPSNPEATKIDVSIDVNSLNTRDADRDGHIKTPDLLNAAEFPTVTFKSKSVSKSGSGYKVEGDLTLRGATKGVTLDVSSVSDEVTDPWKFQRRGVTASATIKRSEFGMGWNMDLPGVGPMVSDEVRVDIDLEITRAA
jgi:polyisoprenoid-binding protein YceI